MQTERQTAANADAATTAAVASDEHVRQLQNQLQSTAEQPAVVEQVVGASGSQAVEPGQTGQPAAATAQPGVPRYVVPPATGDLAYGSSHWDGKPAEIHAIILKHAGPLTRFLNGLLGNTATLNEATKLQLWTDAFKMDWQGDLALLPYVWLTADNGLLLAHSRSMYGRLCKRFPQNTERFHASKDADNNNCNDSFTDDPCDSRWLLLIPMRHGWFDLLDFTYPIALARIAIRFGCLDLLKHLDVKYSTLKDWMANHECRVEVLPGAVDQAAQYGHLDLVQYLFDLGVACTTKAMDNAAKGGQLHVVKWLHVNRTEGCTTRAMDWAAGDGHLHVVKWLHENRTEGCTDQAMIDASTQGRLDMVQWLHETRGQECTSAALDNAVRNGHVDVVKYMHSRGSRASNNAIDSAAAHGNAEMVQYLLDHGYGFGLEALHRARTAEVADILLGSITLDRAQTLLAEAKQGFFTNKTTIERLESTIRKRQPSSE